MTDFGRDEGPADADEATRRLRRFEATGDPGDLWPGLVERARTRAARELARVVAAKLAGEGSVQLDPTGSHDAYALGVAGHTAGIGPVIGRWVEDGSVMARSDVAAAFARHLRHGRERAARIEREALPAIDALMAAGLTPVVLKGSHTGRTLFSELGVRRVSDVDLLLPPDRIGAAESILSNLGFHPSGPASRPYKRDWISREVDPRLFSVELADARSRWSVELHASLDRPFEAGSVARLDRVRDRVEPFDFGGRRLLALARAPLIVMLACHCSHELDGVRLLRLYELVLAVRGGTGVGVGVGVEVERLDWNEVLAVLEETGAARFTFPAFAVLNGLAPGTVDARVVALGRRESTPAARHTVARLAPAGGSLDDRSVVRQLMWTRSPAAVGHRLWRALWPTSGWRTRIRRLRHGAVSFMPTDERRA